MTRESEEVNGGSGKRGVKCRNQRRERRAISGKEDADPRLMTCSLPSQTISRTIGKESSAPFCQLVTILWTVGSSNLSSHLFHGVLVADVLSDVTLFKLGHHFLHSTSSARRSVVRQERVHALAETGKQKERQVIECFDCLSCSLQTL